MSFTFENNPGFKKGNISWNKGKKTSLLWKEYECKICGKEFSSRQNKDRKFCSRDCWRKYQSDSLSKRYNKQTPMECPICQKIFSVKRCHLKSGAKFCSSKCYGKSLIGLTGKESNGWKGGLTSLQQLIRSSLKYLEWKNKVFQKDEYLCQQCKTKANWIEAHHIKGFAKTLRENKIKTVQQALKCEELWDIDNGMTLCKKCHKLTESYLTSSICHSQFSMFATI